MDFYSGAIPIMNPIMDFHVLCSLNSFALGGVPFLLFLFAHIYYLGPLLPSLFSRGEAKQDKARQRRACQSLVKQGFFKRLVLEKPFY